MPQSYEFIVKPARKRERNFLISVKTAQIKRRTSQPYSLVSVQTLILDARGTEVTSQD
jgi:hypothetical protein